MKPKCEDCHYWENIKDTDCGECHRHAPSPTKCEINECGDIVEHGLIFYDRPTTNPEDWCGEFKERAQ